MNIGDYVTIKRSKYFPILNGMIGRIESVEEWSGKTWYKVRAENYGPKIRNTRVWLPGNHRREQAGALEIVV